MEGIIISPALKKPKKQSVEAAQSIVTSASPALTDHKECILLKIAGVIGSLIRLIRGVFWEYTLLIPAWTSRRRDSEEYSLGSGSPSVIWVCRIPARYVLIVLGDRCCDARYDE